MDIATMMYCCADQDYYEPLQRLDDSRAGFWPRAQPPGWRETVREVWRVWEPPGRSLPTQGWKVHISAQLPRAQAVIDAVAAGCVSHRVAFKHLRSRPAYLLMHHKHGDRAQAGKLCTIYPPDERAAAKLMEELAGTLRNEEGPYILTDRRYRDSTVVHYRYGSFTPTRRLLADGTQVALMRDGHGDLREEHRVPWFEPPPGVDDPFVDPAASDGSPPVGTSAAVPADAAIAPSVGGYQFEAALAHSNAGGAYRAVDATGRTVFIKEARAHNGLLWDGTAAQDRLRSEYVVLRELHAAAPGLVPEPLAYFREWEHEFLVTEFLEGSSLHAHLMRSNPYVNPSSLAAMRAYFDQCRQLLAQLGEALERLHQLGYVFGDLSPRNLVVDDEGRLRLVDFETCRRRGEPPVDLATSGFAPQRPADWGTVRGDQYGVGAVALHMFMPLHEHVQRNPATLEHLRAQLALRGPLPDDLWHVAVRDRGGHPDRAEGFGFPSPEQVAAEPVAHLRKLHRALGQELAATARPDDPVRIWPTVPRGYQTNPWCAIYGTAGVVHALHHAAVPIDPTIVDRLRRDPLSQSDQLPPGLYFGCAGIGWVLAELGYLDEAEALLAAAAGHPLAQSVATWGGGMAGIGAAALAIWAMTGQQQHLDEAVRTGNRLLRATPDLPSMLGSPEAAAGLSRGRAGVALFLYYLWRATGDDRYLRSGVALLHQELDRAVEVADDQLGFSDDLVDRVMPYLAVGSAGVGQVLSRYVEVVDDERLAAATPRVFTFADPALTVEPGLGQGLIGLGYAHAEHADHGGRGDPLHTERAGRIARAMFAYAVPFPGGRVRFLGEGLMRYSCELWSGAAGILLGLDRIIHGSAGHFFTLDRLLETTERGGRRHEPAATVQEGHRVAEGR